MKYWRSLVSKKNIKKTVIVAFLAVSLVIYAGMKIYDFFYVSTDNAYVNANVVQIAPRITGQVVALYVTNNQYVHQGDPLFAISEDSYKVTVAKATAQVQINQANLINARNLESRSGTLARQKYVSQQEFENVSTALETAEASLNLAKATLDQANLDLSWTHVTAPTSGWVTNVSLRVGDVVGTNQPLFALISDGEFWVDANFKETELVSIQPNQRAIITVDMYPDKTFEGVVQSISGGTGSAFSLLPPQNATGNWVKVTQRVPVRVLVVKTDPKYPLRIGTSAAVRISLHSQYKPSA
jgi:membrane fusion protein (multidrug efflux system)